jgi:hypothetical protein
MSNTETQIEMFGMTRQELDDTIAEAIEWGDDPAMMAISLLSEIQHDLAGEFPCKENIRQNLNAAKYMISKSRKMARDAE